MERYVPVGPYTIQSGKRKGKALDLLMFDDYQFLRWWVKKINSENPLKKSVFHHHLEWLILRGEDRPVPTNCPSCNKFPVTKLSIAGTPEFGYSMGINYACCQNHQCQEHITRFLAKTPIFLPPKFSSILYFTKDVDQHHTKIDQQQFVRLLREIFKLPSPLTREKAFEFFAKLNQKSTLPQPRLPNF